MKFFSERHGLVQEANEIQKDNISRILKNKLWSALWEYYFGELEYQYLWKNNPKLYQYFKRLWMYYFENPIDTLPDSPKRSIELLREYFFKCPWNHVYDILEFTVKSYSDERKNPRFIDFCNHQLETEKSAYRFKDKEIIEVPPDGLEELVDSIQSTSEPESIDERVKSAIKKFHKFQVSLDDKKDAVRTLADVLEFLRKEKIKLPSKDDSDLFNIINNYDIRHHNKDQNGGYDKECWFEWMFYNSLSSIHLLLNLESKYK